MPATVHVLTGPAGAGKTARLLERFRVIQAEAFDTALWIAPSRRAADALRHNMAACGFALPIFPFQDFVEEIIRVNDPQARPLSDVQRRLLAEELVADLHADKKLSHFERIIDTRGFAEAVFALLAELKENEIWPEFLAPAAGLRGPKITQCVRIYERYQERLIRQHLYDLEGRFWYARDLLERGQFRPFERIRAVFVDGFTGFTRTQHEILQALAGHVAELWIALPDEAGDDRAELFSRPRDTLEKLRPLQPRRELLASAIGRSAGLAHVERQLFRRPRAISQASDADGLQLIEAPGTQGETRLVARAIKQLLLEGVTARNIAVTLRDVSPYADLVREIFGEYGIPVDMEGAEPLSRDPAVAALLRALRLPEEDWPFAGVTALLRSNYFRPDWPETKDDPTVAEHAEALLRLLGEPRDRKAYLRALDIWADHPPKGLEDEEAEGPRRERTHKLAQRCRAFLQRFFDCWDAAPLKAPLAEQAVWLKRFADDLGLFRAAASWPRNRAALERLFDELDRWVSLEKRLLGERSRDRVGFLRLLGALAASAGLPRTVRGPGRVRVLSAELARDFEVPYLFVMGLGERSFPDLSAAEPFFDEADRQAFREAGLDLPGIADRRPDEMLLFYQLVTRARRRLTLSYPAVDDKGQDLLPSSFLVALLDCFAPRSVPTTQQRMLIEGYHRRESLSPAEYRVRQAARSQPFSDASEKRLPAELTENLKAAARLVRQRTKEKDFGPYDGCLRDSAVQDELRKRFGPERVFSPTALETYIACPFQFFLKNVLRLQPLEEPREEIEQTRRGSAFHLALSRLHQKLQSDGVHRPTEEVGEQMLAQLARAVKEHAERAPSPASKVLWELEGKRLEKAASRYREHWQQFVVPWTKHQLAPRPEHFEAGFGLPDAEAAPLVIRVDDVEVRIGGRIDRVDVAEVENGLGFWIIDYKTGKSDHYSAKDLVEFRRLQLPLYAIAVEDVLLAGQSARPLGLAYWLVTEKGPKTVLPSSKSPTSWLDDSDLWPHVREQLRGWVATLVKHIRLGDFQLKPRSEQCADRCDFSQICRIGQSRKEVEAKTWMLELPVVER